VLVLDSPNCFLLLLVLPFLFGGVVSDGEEILLDFAVSLVVIVVGAETLDSMLLNLFNRVVYLTFISFGLLLHNLLRMKVLLVNLVFVLIGRQQVRNPILVKQS
jgi:hypothetical protein